MKKIWNVARVVIIVLVIACSIAFTLYANKEKMEENASMVEKTAEILPVAVITVKKENFNTDFNATGSFEPYRELNFASETQGRIISLFFEKGSIVGEGQTLAKLDDQTLQRNLKMALITLEKVKKDYERFQNLAKENATTGIKIDEVYYSVQNAENQVELIKEQIEKTNIKAPITGIISKKMVEKGSYLMPSSPIADITDITVLKMVVKVDENEVIKIKEGQKVRIKTDVYPGNEYEGIVRNISVKADESKRYAIDIDLQNNRENPLKSGMFGTVYFAFNKTGAALMIPRKAIVGSLRDARVYVVDADNVAHIRNVKTGMIQDNQVEIIEGIKEGDQVVTTGQINLRDSVKVSILK